MKYQEGESSIPRFTPEKVRGELALNRKRGLSFTATSIYVYKTGATVQVCIFITGKIKAECNGFSFFSFEVADELRTGRKAEQIWKREEKV